MDYLPQNAVGISDKMYDHIIHINGKEYTLNDKNFPTIDPKNPYKLSEEEKEIVERLKSSFLHRDREQFIYLTERQE